MISSSDDRRDDRHDDRPIGLFDSGVGGLTVLRALLPTFPDESFIYLGDTARLPYGSKSPQTIERYLSQNISYLVKLGVKAVVVACNSASTVLLGGDDVRKRLFHSSLPPVPVYNVIEPGANLAVKTTENKRIGVLGTRATILSGSYSQAILRLMPEAHIYQQACPLLVPLVEEGWEKDPLTNLIIFRYISEIMQHKIDTLILGCTHYPALRNGIARAAGPGIHFVDSAQAIAEWIVSDLKMGKLRASQSGQTRRKQGRLRLLATDTSPLMNEVATRLMFPHQIPIIEAVDVGAV